MQLRYLKVDTISKLAISEKFFIEEEISPSIAFTEFWPIFIQATSGKYKVWFGYKLLQAIPSNCARIKVFFWNSADEQLLILQTISAWLRLWRELYPLEIARLTKQIVENASANEHSHLFYQLTGQKNLADWLSLYPTILNLHPALQDYLVVHKAPLKIWTLYAAFPPSDQEFIAQITQRYAPTLSQGSIIVKLLQDLVALKHQPLAEIWSSIETTKTSSSKSVVTKISAQELITRLRQLRYPQIASRTAELVQLRQQLPSQAQLQINWDDSFESGTLFINCQLQRARDLKVLHELTEQSNLQVIQQMLDLL